MKAWGWISTRISLGNALKNAFEETIMKNVSINQFRSFKWRNKVQNWNLCKKLSKISHFEKFDFWSKIKVNWSRVKVDGYMVRVGSAFPSQVTKRAAEPLTSSYYVSLTWPRACVACWCGMMTSTSVFQCMTTCTDRGDETDTRAVRVGACDVVWLPDSQPKWIMGQQGHLGNACGWDPSWESRIFNSVCESSKSRYPHVLAHAAAIGGWVSGFWSQYAVKHVCLVGFIKRRLDVHRSDRERHRLLGCWILTQHRAMVAARCRGV